ncbi:MAG: mucoidy inhibitor MuiA family protein [Verrucomicrobia bacterium]|nr:mucoidy inhibitor MuiA family protein [Verrucomicrobiota bacterium]
MKSALSVLGILAVTSLAAAAPVPVNSTISAVTVYTDRAVVTRTGTIDLPAGTTELVFANLPQSLNERSLQVSGRGTAQAQILDVSAKQTFVDFTPNARVKELEDVLRGLNKEVRVLDDRAAVLQAQTTMLDRMEAALFAPPTKDVPRPDLNQFTSSLTFLSDQKTKIIGERTALAEQREDLQNKINTTQSQLNELQGAGGKAYKTVTVRVAATQAGSLDVAVSYTVPGASWAPNYDARVLSGERAVALTYFGLVRQSTGEDWKDVALTLSTARPNLGGAAPTMNPWNLDVFNAIALREKEVALSSFQMKAMRGGANAPAANAADMQRFTTNVAGAVQAPPEQEAELAQAAIEAGTTSASFKIASPSSIASDNAPQKVPVASFKLKANPEYLTVPRQLAAAFLTTKVVNTSEYPLLAGTMNVFLDGTFVATSNLRTVMSGEKFDLALGADEGISVKHKRLNKFTEDTGLTNSGKRITYEYLLTIQNNKRTAERVNVADQLPVSRNEKIVVKQILPDPSDVKPTPEGYLKWTLDLKPGEKKELTVKFTVDYPNDVNVTGLE